MPSTCNVPEQLLCAATTAVTTGTNTTASGFTGLEPWLELGWPYYSSQEDAGATIGRLGGAGIACRKTWHCSVAVNIAPIKVARSWSDSLFQTDLSFSRAGQLSRWTAIDLLSGAIAAAKKWSDWCQLQHGKWVTAETPPSAISSAECADTFLSGVRAYKGTSKPSILYNLAGLVRQYKPRIC